MLPSFSSFSPLSPSFPTPPLQAVGCQYGLFQGTSSSLPLASALLPPPLPAPPFVLATSPAGPASPAPPVHQRGGGVQRLQLPDRGQRSPQRGEFCWPAGGGQPSDCAGQWHQPPRPSDTPLWHHGDRETTRRGVWGWCGFRCWSSGRNMFVCFFLIQHPLRLTVFSHPWSCSLKLHKLHKATFSQRRKPPTEHVLCLLTLNSDEL